jgi:Ran GTPase-activating protein (RanGAP) involved in mRNA processing and transport
MYHTLLFHIPAGITALANAISDTGAMTRLNLSKNQLLSKEGGRVLGNMLKANTIPKELDVSGSGHAMPSSQRDATGFATEITEGLAGNGAISSVNLLQNDIGTDQAKDLAGILKEHPTLKSLCGNTGNETELDMSGKMHGAGDLLMFVPDIVDNGALSVLSLKQNSLGTKEAGKALGEMLKVNSVLKELDLSDNGVASYEGGDAPGFAQELALGIRDNGALTSLDISANNLTNYGTDMSGKPREHVFGLLI